MSFANYVIDSTNQVLAHKYAPGVEVHVLTAPDEGATAVGYILEGLALSDDDEREKLANVLIDYRFVRAVTASVLGDLVRKITLPLIATDATLLADTLTSEAVKAGHVLAPRGAQALHGLFYIALRRLTLVSEHDTTALSITAHRQVLPSIDRLEQDLVRYWLKRTIVLPDLVTEKAMTGTLIFKRLQLFFSHVSIGLRQSTRLKRDFHVVLGSLNDFVTNRVSSTYRETKDPFPALSRILPFVKWAVDDRYAERRIHLPEAENFDWLTAISNVYEYVGSTDSDYALIAADEFASWFQITRVHSDRDKRFGLIHVARAFESTPTLYALGVSSIRPGAVGTELLVRNEKISEKLKAWQDLTIPAFDQTSWIEMARSLIGRGDVGVDATVITCSDEEFETLAWLNTLGFRADADASLLSTIVEFQFERDPAVDRLHVAHRHSVGNLVSTEAPEDVILFGLLPRHERVAKYPAGQQTPERWLSTALVHTAGLRMVSLRHDERVVVTRFSGQGQVEETRSLQTSMQDLFDIHHYAREVRVLENPVATGAYEAPLVLGIALAWAVQEHPYAKRQLGMAVANRFASIINSPDITRAAHVLFSRLRWTLQSMSDFDGIRTWGNATFVVMFLLIKHLGQLSTRTLMAFRDATDFPRHVDDVLLAKALYSGA